MQKIYSADEIVNHAKGERYMLIQLHKTLKEWGMENSRLLRSLPANRNDLSDLHAAWLQALIADYYYFGDMKTFGNIRSCPAVQIFAELSRTHFILMYPLIMEESAVVRQRGEYTEGLLIGFKMSECEHMGEDSNWNTPIMMYTQQDVMNALLMLSEKLDQFSKDALSELQHVLKILYTRNSVFLCEESTPDILNVPNMTTATNTEGFLIPNRDYLTFCSIYFHAIQRRIFYFAQVKQLPPPDAIDAAMEERVKRWVASLVDALGKEGFEDCYAKACEESYNFPGDLEWFKYRYPNLPAQTGPILDCFRKKYAERYYMDYRASKESVLGVVDQDSHSGHAARIFVLNAVDQYMKTQFSIPWRDGLVIDNAALEGNQVKLYRSRAPYFLQVFSRHWVYDRAAVYPSDRMYQSLAIWMYLLKERHQCKVFGVSLERLVTKIVDNVQTKSFRAVY